MHLRLKCLSLVAASVLFSVSSPQPIIGTTLNAATSDLQEQKIKNSEAEADQLSQDAIEQLQRGQLLEAAQNFELALEIYREMGNSARKDAGTSAKEIEILRNLIGVYTSLKDSKKTIEISKATLSIAQEIRDRDTELELQIALGDTYNSLGKYDLAVEAATASLVLAEELKNSQGKAAAFVTLASAYQSLASTPMDYQKASQAAALSLTTAWKIKDYDSEAKALAILAGVSNSLSDHQKAITFAQQGLKVAKENNIPTAAASSLLTLGGVHLEEGEYQNAIVFTEQGIDYLRKLQQHEEESGALALLGLAYFGAGNSNQTLNFAEKGLAISQEVKSPLMEALAVIVLSLNSSDSGDFQKAIELINQSRVIAKEQKNRDLEALVLEVLGGIYRKAGEQEQAIASYQESITIKDTYSAQAGIAGAYQDLNLLETAITYYKKAVNKNEEQLRSKIPGLPVWLQESFPQAVQDLNGVPTAEIYRSLTNLLLLKKRIPEAQQVLELLKGQELREYTGNPRANGSPVSLTITPTEEQILQEYGSLISFGYRLDECQQASCRDLNQLLEQRAVLTKQYYQALQQLETKIRNTRASDEAFVDPNQLTLKAQAIVEAQPNTVLIYPMVLEDKIWLLWASQGGILKSVEVTGVTQAQLEVTVLRFRQLLQNRLSNMDEVADTGKQLYDWLVKPLENELKANNIHNLVFSLDRSTRYIPMSALFDGEKFLIENYAVSTVVSANLTDIGSTGNDSNVASIPSGSNSDRELVANLQASASESLLLASGFSKEAPQQTSAPRSDNQDTAILGLGVSDAIAGFRPLPHVPPELDAIVRQEVIDSKGIYPGQKFLNRAFDFFALRDNLVNHQILHIATHGKFVPGRASKSYLLLGTGEKLSIPDIENWQVNLRDINLVVLSACETALGGPGLNGKEIAGMGYYFLKRGAKTVMASLWHVDDLSTRLLMERFYNNLAKGTPQSPVAKAEALRQAQLELLRGNDTAEAQMPSGMQEAKNSTPPLSVEQQDDSSPTIAKRNSFRHPYYWAPFILMGNSL